MTIPTLNLAAWRGIIVAYTALVTGGSAFWVSMRPTRPASRLGMRGLKRQRALLEPVWATIEPFIRWMGVRVSGILDDKTRDKMDLGLTTAGDWRGITVDEYFGMLILGGIIGALFSGVMVSIFLDRYWFLIPIFALIGAAFPHLSLENARAVRFREMNHGLPYAIDLMSLSMSAGMDFPGAIHQVVSKAKANIALRDELGYMLQQFQLGRLRSQVLAEFAKRVPIEAVTEFVHALLQAEERGSPVAHVLEIQASTSRIRRSNLAQKAAEDMKGKMILPIMMVVGVSLAVVGLPASMMMDSLVKGFQ